VGAQEGGGGLLLDGPEAGGPIVSMQPQSMVEPGLSPDEG
jgi:hypothetical protein